MSILSSLHSLRAPAALGILAALLLSLTPPALAYPPPCKRGDLYVGAGTFEDASCVQRKFLKIERAQQLRAEHRTQVVYRGESFRTIRKKTRMAYLHPTRRNLIIEAASAQQDVVDLNFPEKVHLASKYFPVITGIRQVALARQDTSDEAMLSFRTRRAEVKKEHRENPRQVTR